MVAEVDARVEGEEGGRPREEGDDASRAGGGDADAVDEAEEGKVGRKEEHELRVAGGPTVGVADLEDGAHRRGAGLVDGGFDELVDDLGDNEAEGEAEALQLPPEDEVGDEPTKADEDRDQGHPRQEVAQGVAPRVPDVGQCNRLQRRGRCVLHFPSGDGTRARYWIRGRRAASGGRGRNEGRKVFDLLIVDASNNSHKKNIKFAINLLVRLLGSTHRQLQEVKFQKARKRLIVITDHHD